MRSVVSYLQLHSLYGLGVTVTSAVCSYRTDAMPKHRVVKSIVRKWKSILSTVEECQQTTNEHQDLVLKPARNVTPFSICNIEAHATLKSDDL